MEDNTQSKSKKNEITIAVIGLLGVLVTAVFSNWDKIFPNPNEVRANYSGYRATGVFETELRYLFEVSGQRIMIENLQQQAVIALRNNLIREHPENVKEINLIMDASLEEAPTVDDIIRKLLPIYGNYFTIEELQELNKFYSTEIMQNMIIKTPALMQEFAPLQLELIQDHQVRIADKLGDVLN